MKVVLVDNYDSFSHLLLRLAIDALKAEVSIVKNDRLDHALLEQSDLIILSPGPGLPAESGKLMEVIERYYRRKPMLGVCLGHQAIAGFFGAELVNLPEVCHGYQSKVQILDRESLFKYLPETSIQVGRYHSWVIRELTFPPDLLITAKDEMGQIMGFRHRTLPLEGVQFHPESYMTEWGRDMLKGFAEVQMKKS